MLTPWLLLAAPVIAAALFWGAWVAVGLALVIAIVQFLSFRRTEQFSSRVWRTVGHGRRSREARAADGLYLVSVVAGLAVFVVAVLGRI